MKQFAFCISLLLFGGCGYHVATNEDAVAVSIPFVEGDPDGRLTDVVATAISGTGLYVYAPSRATHRLEVRVLKNKTEQIGYQYRTKDNDSKIFNRLVPDEGRRTVEANVTLVELRSGKTIVGPTKVSTFVDYDFVNPDSYKDLAFDNLDGENESVLQFSLGQLDSKEGAESASLDPAFRQVAEEIARVLTQRN